MENSKKHIKLFDRAFTMQLFRVLLPLGVTMTAIELLISLDIITLSSSLMFGSVHGNSIYSGLLMLYFALAGYRLARLVRSSEVRLYGCIPLAKRTIWGSALLAALMWGGAALLAHIAGYLILWFGIIGSTVRFDVVPPSHYLHIISVLEAILTGLALYGIVNLCTALTGNFFYVLLLLMSSSICLQMCEQVIRTLSAARFGPISLLLPVGMAAGELIDWLAKLIFAGGALTAAYFAFTRSRAETAGRFSGIKLHIAFISICSLLMICVTCNGLVLKYRKSFITAAALPLLVGAVIYAMYMIILRRSFKKGVKLLAYYPITIGVFLLIMLASSGLKKLDASVVISTDTIDCVMLSEQHSVYGEYDYNSVTLGGAAKADIGSEKYYEFRDKDILAGISLAFADRSLIPMEGIGGRSSLLIEQLTELDGGYYDGTVKLMVKLKDGRQYAMRFQYQYDNGSEVMNAMLHDEDYLKECTDIERFKHGHVSSPLGLDRIADDEKLFDTLLEELAELTPEQRAEVFMVNNGSFDRFVGSVVIASPMNRFMQSVALTELTPRSTELYMRLCFENAKRSGRFDKLLTELNESGGVDTAQMTVIDENGKLFTNTSIYYESDASVAHKQKELLIDILTSAKAPGETECVAEIGDLFVLSGLDYDDPDEYGNWTYCINTSMTRFFLGITAEQAEELKEAFGLSDPNDQDYEVLEPIITEKYPEA